MIGVHHSVFGMLGLESHLIILWTKSIDLIELVFDPRNIVRIDHHEFKYNINHHWISTSQVDGTHAGIARTQPKCANYISILSFYGHWQQYRCNYVSVVSATIQHMHNKRRALLDVGGDTSPCQTTVSANQLSLIRLLDNITTGLVLFRVLFRIDDHMFDFLVAETG
jgi:hypothetical protein